ncbi:hypothetical protein [Paenibacillus rhizoplanae]|uniref:Uncharacterized protein n=1 Tax=Paenibacillus rhizoplanae TaxID=1917181 RepID=A0ABW5FH22_9BACL
MIKKILFTAASSLLIVGSAASAAPTVGGYSSGGSLGTTYCSGVLQADYSNGRQGAIAENYTSAKGSQTARVTVAFTYSNGDRGYKNGATGSRDNDTYVQAVGYADSGNTAIYASATHTYYSGNYGSWTGTTNINL